MKDNNFIENTLPEDQVESQEINTKEMGSLLKDQSGVTLIEYALLAALIAIVSIVMITGVGQSVNRTFSVVNSALTSATPG